jgi:glutamyl-tRNA synthetase
MILGPDRSKLSKRHGATSVLDYKEMGFIPQALVNFIVLLGWSLDDKTEIFDSRQLSEVFSMDRVVKSGAIFNREKLDWMNGYYIRQMSVEQLTDSIISYWTDFPPEQISMPIDHSFLSQIVPLVQERLKTLAEVEDKISFFICDTLDYTSHELAIENITEQEPTYVLQQTLTIIDQISLFSRESLENELRSLAENLNLSPRKYFGMLRIAITARSVSPPLFETMEVLGRGICKDRILSCIAWIETFN